MARIKCEVGVAYGAPGGTWDTMFVEIPPVAEEKVAEFAIRAVQKRLERIAEPGLVVAGYFLYHYELEGDDG